MKILSRISAFLLRTSRTVILLGSILLVTTICSASRISGTYVAHGTDFAEMLRLTQTDNGQVSGVLISVQLEAGGNITSRQTAVTGVTDADQLTLGNMAGTVRGNTIQLQWVDPKGNVATSAFVRSTPDDFKAYADQLKSKGRGIVLSTQLTEGAQRFRQTVQSAEKWIGNAELHADRIPRVKAAYEKIENQMRSLVAQERSEPYGSVARTQISVMVGQGDIAGGQTDIEVSQIWDFGIEEPGTGLYKDHQLGWELWQPRPTPRPWRNPSVHRSVGERLQAGIGGAREVHPDIQANSGAGSAVEIIPVRGGSTPEGAG
ncbi:MAG: hypothetical protein ACHP78_14720 [Terriglobales bacterium]